MVHISLIEARLSQLGVKLSRWFQAEVRELQHILFDHENIIAIVPGRYFAGYALLIATDQRLLLIDKRTFFLTVDDIRYDMIAETDYNSRLMDATLQIYTLNKQHRFTTFKYKQQLRDLTRYVQQRVMQLRQGNSGNPTDPSARYAHVSAFLPSASHSHILPAAPRRERSHHLPKWVGAAALKSATRLNSYTPNMSYMSQFYTGPSFLSGFINRR